MDEKKILIFKIFCLIHMKCYIKSLNKAYEAAKNFFTFSMPQSFMYPIPPRIWMASSVTNQADSEAKTFEIAASSW